MKTHNIEGILKPEKLHDWYLEATKKLNPASYNPNAQKAYSDLTEEQKFIDKYIAKKISQEIKSLLEELKTEIEKTEKFMWNYADENIRFKGRQYVMTRPEITSMIRKFDDLNQKINSLMK